MSTVVYCAKDKREQVAKELDQTHSPYVFASPQDQAVNHSASGVVIVGPHVAIAERYKGIAHIEFIELEQDTDETDREE